MILLYNVIYKSSLHYLAFFISKKLLIFNIYSLLFLSFYCKINHKYNFQLPSIYFTVANLSMFTNDSDMDCTAPSHSGGGSSLRICECESERRNILILCHRIRYASLIPYCHRIRFSSITLPHMIYDQSMIHLVF